MSVPVAGGNPNGEVQKLADKGFRSPVYNGTQDLRSMATSSHSASSDVSGGDSHGVLVESNSSSALFPSGVDWSGFDSSQCSGNSSYSADFSAFSSASSIYGSAFSSAPSTDSSTFSSAEISSATSKYPLPNFGWSTVANPPSFHFELPPLDCPLYWPDYDDFVRLDLPELEPFSPLFTDKPKSSEVSREFSNDSVLSESSGVSWSSTDSGYHTDRKRAHRRKKACEYCRKRKRRCEHQSKYCKYCEHHFADEPSG
jgi:hypothetical protein